ncbi:thiamine-phosphate kinase [Oceanidesulfovibrio marinus]|uniref:Thiamine-monophosphate kinase n=1 Tax=Oceanidesulfovibrio marinus TaxID=370038 RepID=A0A6P1ZH12_9BACT|nr:thiamine-phosphate kinase [Oceanidesulfovibrio marinus]TVM33709.1 thiamine-phosphate kinase [Oceanidesulfovibrio marinus]
MSDSSDSNLRRRKGRAPGACETEDDFFHYLDTFFDREHPSLELGRGDDCAVLNLPGKSCFTTDLFLEDVHFRTRYFTPGEIGHKGLAVNLSDLAGMGVKPTGFLLNLIVPGDDRLDAAFWDEFFAAMAKLANDAGAVLAGGDLSAGPNLGMAITAWGVPEQGSAILTRGPVSPGDIIFTVGGYGLARTGLMRMEAEGRDAEADFPAAVAAHCTPQPKLAAGLVLGRIAGESGGVTGLMDLSDGIARDLPRLLGFEHGAALDIPSGSLHEEIRRHAQETGEDPVEFAVVGGEDYALLGAASPSTIARLEQEVEGLRPIGEVVPDKGLTVNGKHFTRTGFDHFGR